jgi:zinc protease
MQKLNITELPTGIRVVTRVLPDEPNFEIVAMVEAGSRDEGNSPQGCAHFFEHLPLNVSENLKPHEFWRRVGAWGGSANATTNLDKTQYFIVAGKDYAKDAVTFLADCVCRPVVPEAQLEQERNAILLEWLESQMSPERRNMWRGLPLAYGDNPFTRPVLGTRQSIMQMTAQDILSFHKDQYRAGRLVVAAEGAGFDHDTFVQWVEREFSLPYGTRPPHLAPQYQGGGSTVSTGEEGTRVYLILKSAASSSYLETPASFAFLNYVSNGSTSPFHQSLRIEGGLVYGVRPEIAPTRDTGILTVSCTTFPENVRECLSRLSDIFAQAAIEIDRDRLATVHAAIISGRDKRATQPTWGPSNFGYDVLCGQPILPPTQAYDDMISVRPADISRVSATLLSAPPTLVLEGNLKGVPSYEEACDLFRSPRDPRSVRMFVSTKTGSGPT